MTKLSNDPTQSLWLEKKYVKALNQAMTDYTAGLVGIIQENVDDMEKVRQLQAAYKTEQIDTVFRPLAKKYVELSVKQGGKFADIQMKVHGRKK